MNGFVLPQNNVLVTSVTISQTDWNFPPASSEIQTSEDGACSLLSQIGTSAPSNTTPTTTMNLQTQPIYTSASSSVTTTNCSNQHLQQRVLYAVETRMQSEFPKIHSLISQMS